MEKIIAKEISPSGIDSVILDFIQEKTSELGLEDSILYYGYPVFKDYEDLTIKSKFAILSRQHGLIFISSSSRSMLKENDQNLSQLYTFVESTIRKSRILRRGKKKIIFNLETYLYLEDIPNIDSGDYDNEILSSLADIENYINENLLQNPITEEEFNEARSIIEGAKALSGTVKRKRISEDPRSKSNILIELENEIMNFDQEQRKVALSLINGPQRIRGLAGSGKTIILAMKAAHIHLQYPEKKVLVTFYTKSLYNLLEELISRFYRHFAGTEPDWENIDILHSWGGKYVSGVYYNVCTDNQIQPLTLQDAKRFDPVDPFQFICQKTLDFNLRQKYDYILVDEAQDLPNSFFEMCFKIAKGDKGHEKNIVWAYDELQSIFNVYQRKPCELFGKDSKGNPRIDLELFQDRLKFGQSNDLVLYKCYRNPLEVLITAHALGFGIYGEPVQMLENKAHWEDVGYVIEENPEITIGEEIIIDRPRKNSPLSIYNHQDINDIIKYKSFRKPEDEADWVVGEILSAIEDGLEPHDILVICLDDSYAKSYFARISLKLAHKSIRSHNLLTPSTSGTTFKSNNMVTLSTVYKAKGNEAALVFTLGIDALASSKNSRQTRNRIFTAFTRTKAWLRITGIGSGADIFFSEIQNSLDNSPKLKFIVPDAKEIETIQRDLAEKPSEILRLHKAVDDLVNKGYSKEQIQMELGFVGERNNWNGLLIIA